MLSIPALAATPNADKLTPKQKAFCEALIKNNGDIREAALSAGYSKSNPTQSAYAALQVPHVMAYMQSLVAIRLMTKTTGASSTLIDLATGAKSEYVRLQAAQDLLDRVGMKAPEKVDHRVTGELSVSIDLG